ncbi:hypothetical protein RR48_02283 [Papilio machaon]|uniref:Uncharacterized protein n=1 Tax=Papilio machaon TaxID=76193 RepID=A0A0N0PCM7_PAPMA|nr:hypothetical protein RR48_02283 [Papilio machaon]
MKILLIRYFLWQFAITFVDLKDVISDEKHDLGNDGRQDTIDFDSHRSNRRFKKEDDEEWHVAHLKKRDKPSNSRCKAETLQDRIARYKQSIREDAALLEFVSVDAIPVDVKDIKDPCLNDTDIERRNDNDSVIVKNKNITKLEESTANVTLDGILYKPATTANVKEVLTEAGVDKEVEAEKIRRSEYQFSSIEYYEETSDFDPSTCPDEVDVISLQVDDLQKIDIECELMIEWKSLE